MYKIKDEKNQNFGKWVSGTPKNPIVYPNYASALEYGKKIRDEFIQAAEMIKSSNYNSIVDYEVLSERLSEIFKEMVFDSVVVHKYLHMLFPDKFNPYHGKQFMKSMLNHFNIEPTENLYVNDGFLSLIAKNADISTMFLYNCINNGCSTSSRRKFWLLSPGENAKFWNEYKENNIISIGWDLGDLSNLNNKTIISKNLGKKYSDHDSNIVSNMLFDFSNEMRKGDIVFTRKGASSILGYGEITSDYYYTKDLPNLDSHYNRRNVKWIKFCDENEGFIP